MIAGCGSVMAAMVEAAPPAGNPRFESMSSALPKGDNPWCATALSR
jgi:hypothetical protein